MIRSCPGSKYAGTALLDYLAGRFDYKEREAWRTVIAAGEIFVDGVRAAENTLLDAASDVEWFPPEDLPEPETDNSFSILLLDGDIIAVNKILFLMRPKLLTMSVFQKIANLWLSGFRITYMYMC